MAVVIYPEEQFRNSCIRTGRNLRIVCSPDRLWDATIFPYNEQQQLFLCGLGG
jgi:hypothetical protein